MQVPLRAGRPIRKDIAFSDATIFRGKIKVKGSGQECPLHTIRATLTAVCGLMIRRLEFR
jgi:hypothetical protein